jgi:hypothetical protein
VLVLYAVVGFGTVFALRLLRRRWAAAGVPEEPGDVPYGPSRAAEETTEGAQA